MAWQGMPYTILLIAAAVISAASALYVWRRHPVPGSGTVMLTAFAGAAWMAGYALELGSPDPMAKDFWNKVQYLGIVIVPASLFVFALQYTGRKPWVTARNLLLLSIEPLLTLLLVFTNETHGLVWQGPVPAVDTAFSVLSRPHGAGYWVHAIYSYGLSLITVFLFVQMLARSHQLYRRQVTVLLLAASLPILANLVMQSGLSLPPYIDLTPLSFTASGLILAWSLPRLRTVDILPVARWAVIENMSDGVIVLDEQNRIVDLNRAAQRLVGRAASEAIGHPIEHVWPGWPAGETRSDATPQVREIGVEKQGGRCVYDVRVSPLLDWRDRLVGQTVVLRDISEIRQRTLELSALLEVARAPSSALDLETALALMAEQMTRVMEVDGCTLSRWDPEGAAIVTWIEWRRRGDELVDEPGNIYLLGDFPATQGVLDTRRPLTIHASDPNADPAEVALMQRAGSAAVLMLPLVVGDRTVGLVKLHQAECERRFTADEIRLCQALADQAAVIIDNARLYEEAQRQARELAVLNKTGQVIASTLDLDQVLLLAMNEVMAMVDAEAASVLLHDPIHDELEFATIVGPAAETLVGRRMPSTAGIAGWVVQKGRPLLVRDVQNDPRFYRRVDDTTGMTTRSLLAVPLKYKEKTIGVLEAMNKNGRNFDKHDLDLLSTLAGSAAAAIENARLYEEIRRQADELAAAVDRLQELDRLKSEFIQNVSHELRTPLALMQGYAEVLDSGELGELRPEHHVPVSIIARRARVLAELVGDIGMILETEVNPPQPEPVPLDQLVRIVLDDFQLTVRQAGLTLNTDIAPAVPAVNGYSTYLRRVLDSLLNNAIKFTPQGGTVTVRLWPEAGQVVLEVCDTGIGIAADQCDRIFDRFYQVDGSTKRRYGGAGLGLALVKEIVAAYDGSVAVHSTLGEGSTFTVTLPVFRKHTADEEEKKVGG
jgi:PAS domain S-box-containing protein